MKIAVPIWNEKVSPVFDTASRLLLINKNNLSKVERFEIYISEQDISKRCLLIQGLKVNVLICGAISRPFSMMLISTGVKIISGISGLAEEVLKAYLHGSLSNSKYLMPGCKTNISEQINDNLSLVPERKLKPPEIISQLDAISKSKIFSS
jgi:predicted Fe-Mo cluster-binding NifX family protein